MLWLKLGFSSNISKAYSFHPASADLWLFSTSLNLSCIFILDKLALQTEVFPIVGAKKKEMNSRWISRIKKSAALGTTSSMTQHKTTNVHCIKPIHPVTDKPVHLSCYVINWLFSFHDWSADFMHQLMRGSRALGSLSLFIFSILPFNRQMGRCTFSHSRTAWGGFAFSLQLSLYIPIKIHTRVHTYPRPLAWAINL